MNDVVVQAVLFGDNLRHIDTVLGNLTTAVISKIYPHSAYELKDEGGRAREKFIKKALKPCREDNSMSWKQMEDDRVENGSHMRRNELLYCNYQNNSVIWIL